MTFSHLLRRRLRVFGPLMSILLLGGPLVAQETVAAATADDDVSAVATALIIAGTPAAEAKDQAAALTDADRRVLLAHPAMLQSASANAAVTAPPDAPVLDPVLHLQAVLMAAEVTPEDALRQLQSLTSDDLRVLFAHPGMLQRAGTMSHMNEAVLIGVLIVAGIIALAASGSGFVSIH